MNATKESNTVFDRVPPHNITAEQGVIGSMLLNPEVITDVYFLVKPEDFYRPAHQILYNKILGLYGEATEIDPIILAGELDRSGELDSIGGPTYISDLMAMVPTAANGRYYAKIVREKSIIRSLAEAGTKIAQIAYTGADDTEAETLVSTAQETILSIGREDEHNSYSPIADIIDTTLEELDFIAQNGGIERGIPTGFTALDKLTNGLRGGQMVIIAARPGVGKSTLAVDFMREASIKHNKTSVIFSLEMSKEELMTRILAAESRVTMTALRSGDLSGDDWAKLVQTSDKIRNAPLYVDDSPNLTMAEIRGKARQLKQQGNLDMIVLDYLQLLSSGKKVESRQQEVSEFSRQLKLLAKELNVPLIALSQLNRGPEARTDKKPQLADLRESGSLEQDADIVLLIYRPDSQDFDSPRAGEADIIVAKHRGGATGTITVGSQLQYSRFVNLMLE